MTDEGQGYQLHQNESEVAMVIRPDHKFSGFYDGSQPAVRRLYRFDYDMEPICGVDEVTPAGTWISSFAMLMSGKAGTWQDATQKSMRSLRMRSQFPSGSPSKIFSVWLLR